MKFWQKALAVVTTLGLTGATVAFMFSNQEEPEVASAEEPIWDVRTVSLDAGDFRPQIHLIGQIEPVNDITEVAQLATQVDAILVRDGEYANKGDIIIRLDDFDAKLQVAQLQADAADLKTRVQMQKAQLQLDNRALNVEKAQLKLLQERLVQQEKIQQTGLAAQQSIDDLKQQIQRQKFTVLQREAAITNHPISLKQLSISQQKLNLSLSAAQRHLNNANVTAPFSGNVAQILVSHGQRINAGQPLFRIYSSDEMNIQVQLPTQLQQQRTVLNGTAFSQNRISDISFSRSEAQLNQGQSGFKAWFNLEPSNQWLPGDVATIRLNLPAAASTYKIPAVALFQDRWLYSVDEEQRLKALEVKVLGSLNDAESVFLVVESKQPLVDVETGNSQSLRLLATRLNNPTTGMKIYEKGIDPEPPEAEEEVESDEENGDSEEDADENENLDPEEADNEDN